MTPFCSVTHMYTACLHDSELAMFNFLHHAIDVCLCFECCATGSKKFGFLLLLQCTVCWCTISRLWKCKYDVCMWVIYVLAMCTCAEGKGV